MNEEKDIIGCLSKVKLSNEPDWFNGRLSGKCAINVHYKEDEPIQEDDGLRLFLEDIGNFGLKYAYMKYHVFDGDPCQAEEYKYQKTDRPKNIIIIGAGMSGLVSGYELAQVGHNVKILEMQHRVGGRVKTLGDEVFHKGLWSDAGAMRLPGTGEVGWDGPIHFMTDFYAQQFQLPLKQFINTGDQGYYSFYGEDPIKMEDWNNNSTAYCKQFWPRWDSTICAAKENNPDLEHLIIKDIGAYWNETAKPVSDQLRKWLETDPCGAWKIWVVKWSGFSVKDFLRSTYAEVILKLQNIGQYNKKEDALDLEPLRHLLPWPIDAVIGFGAITYTLSLDVSLVDWLRDELGQWWVDPMHTFEDGMQMLPQAFAKKNDHGWNNDVDLSKNVQFGVSAHEIRYGECADGSGIKVICHNHTTKKEQVFTGDMVIISLPTNIIRQLTFTPSLPYHLYKAVENISYSPSTKIMLQCKEQFWQENGINGGFSKTNMPIGQLHYPSNPDFGVPREERGILMCYTWKQEALLFGSQSSESAIAEAVEEVSVIHPNIYDYFEVGAIQAWYDDPSSQGAFCFPRPEEYLAQQLLYYPHSSLYFCGEALSTSNGWIQGALVSGLRSAYELFLRNESPTPAKK